MRILVTVVRVITVLAAITTGCLVLWWAAASPAGDAWRGLHGWRPRGGWSLDVLVTDLLACVALVVGLGLAAVTTLTVVAGLLETLRPSLDVTLPALTPLRWRRLVLTACGLAATSPILTGPAFAAEPSSAASPACVVSCPAPITGLELPDLPLSEPRPAPIPRTIEVDRGDSLWTIAASAAPPQAADATIAHEVALLYAANRDVIGSNPDLIYPGTILTLPGENS